MCIIGKIIYVVSISLNWIQIPKNDNTHQTTPEILIQISPYKISPPGSGFGYPNFFKRLTYTFYHGGEKWRKQV